MIDEYVYYVSVLLHMIGSAKCLDDQPWKSMIILQSLSLVRDKFSFGCTIFYF